MKYCYIYVAVHLYLNLKQMLEVHTKKRQITCTLEVENITFY